MSSLELPEPSPKKLNAYWAGLDDLDKTWLYDMLTDHYIPQYGTLAGEVVWAFTAESISTILRDCGLIISSTTLKHYRRNVLRYELLTTTR